LYYNIICFDELEAVKFTGTMEKSQIHVNNQPDALFSMYLFISVLYMFWATQHSSSVESKCVDTSSGIYHSV